MPLSTAIDAGASLISNLFSKHSNDSANRNNMRIAQMNNEWSEKMMQKQMDYNTQQWEREAAYNDRVRAETNEYNSASSQAKRLREAGLNPALIMNGSNAGTAQGGSAPIGNSVGLPSPSSASYQPYRYDFSGIGNALRTAISIDNQNQVQESQARFTNMQADYYGAKTMAEISKMMAEADSHTAKTYYQNLLNKYGDNMLGAEYINVIRQNQSLDVQITNAIRQGVLMDKQISRYDEQTNAQIADLVASASLKYSQGQLNNTQVKSVIEDVIGKKLSNKEKSYIFDYIVEQAKNAATRSGQPQNIWQGFSDAYSGFNKFIDNEVVKRSKRLWKDTKRSFGLYW